MPEVDILRCPSCGADVALGTTDDARCAHCNTTFPLPESYRAYRRLQGEDEAVRIRAQVLLASLDTPPWLVTRIFAAVFDQPMFAFWIFFGVPVGLASVGAGLAVDARLHPAPAVTCGVIFAALFVFAFVPRAAGIYANARTSGRSVLLAGLAAKQPKLPGGPSCCRGCGAPLDVPPDAIVARCLYCHVESAVRIRTPLLAGIRRAASARTHTMEQAIAIDRRDRAQIRAALAKALRRYLLVTATFGALFAVWMWDYQRSQARGDDAAPALGLAAMIVATILLIALMFRAGRPGPREVEEARQRRGGNGLPGWVRFVGPIGFWAFLWALRAMV